MTLVEAVRNRDIRVVKAVLETGADLEERSKSGRTPLMLAVAGNVYLIAELLIDSGADVFAHDALGISVGALLETSRLHPDRPEGAARLRVLEKMKARGFPFPAPRPEDLLARVAAGTWPPKKP